MKAGASRTAPELQEAVPQPTALAPAPHPRPVPPGQALPAAPRRQVGQFWTPIVGQFWTPIDRLVHLSTVRTPRLAMPPQTFLRIAGKAAFFEAGGDQKAAYNEEGVNPIDAQYVAGTEQHHQGFGMRVAVHDVKRM